MLALRCPPSSHTRPPTHHLQALADELKVRPGELVARYRELGCVDIVVNAATAEGGRSRGWRVSRCRWGWVGGCAAGGEVCRGGGWVQFGWRVSKQASALAWGRGGRV